jgi:hypothetical protein
MRTLAARLSAIPEATGPAPWPDHEYVRGWGVFGLPFDSGHVLALRVFPQSTFGPYRTLWHRDPDGHWSIYADAPELEHACPRYYGAACTRQERARISLTWTGPRSLQVELDEPALTWTLTAHSTPALAVLNATSRLTPLAWWRPAALRRLRERVAERLGMGRLQLAGTMPSGHDGILMPQRMYLVDDARATLDGTDLGRPTRLEDNPTIGGVPLPARGVLAQGQAMWRVRHEGALT